MKPVLLFLLFMAFAVNGYTQSKREVTMQVGDTTEVLKRYVFMLLNDGPNRTQDSATVAKLMKGHMNHLQEMAKTKKLVVAGPFENGGKFRGILIFDVDSIAQAVRMESADPAVVAGRFEMQAIYWWTMKGNKFP